MHIPNYCTKWPPLAAPRRSGMLRIELRVDSALRVNAGQVLFDSVQCTVPLLAPVMIGVLESGGKTHRDNCNRIQFRQFSLNVVGNNLMESPHIRRATFNLALSALDAVVARELVLWFYSYGMGNSSSRL